MDDGFDFVAACRPGMILRTRDRREATITRVDAAKGLVHGEVPQTGSCSWRRDGVYSEAPGGAAGPLDLTPPAAPPAARRTVALKDALGGDGRGFCCD
jgi:hypothetical protein